MGGKLNMVIETQKKLIQEKDVEIARLKAYLQGVNDGYILAKGDIVEILKSLPTASPNIDSISFFFVELGKAINKINGLKKEY